MATHGRAHTRRVHHLSQRALTDATGWVESISALSENAPATQLLAAEEEKGSKENGMSVSTSRDDAPGGNGEQQELTLDKLTHQVECAGELLADIGVPEWGYGPVHLSEEKLESLLSSINDRMEAIGADATILRRRKLPSSTASAADTYAADILLRRRADKGAPVEIRVAIIGNVDSGKSTMVGVLTRSVLDDGRGSARSRVFKHHHEESTGRTSSIGQHNLCLDSKGRVLNDISFKTQTTSDYISRASKIITLVDLAGHEKYFKTTAFGLTGHLPDYACLIVGANAGVVGMCKEHMGVALALRVPCFFVVTKVDLAPDHVTKHTLSTLTTILRRPGVKKKPFLVKSKDDVMTCARSIHSDSLAPIFLTSSVTGRGLDLIRLFYNLLPQRHDWHSRIGEPAEFVIDETFGVPGVGTVVAGTVKRGVLTPNCTLLLGPDILDGAFRPCAVKSIHYKRLPVNKVVAGQSAALALKKIKRAQVRKGMVLADEKLHPHASWEFDADIAILTHSTTIQEKYQAVIHCEIVRQSAKVVSMDKDRLRSGDRAGVRFRFLQRPEYLIPGTRFVFREGRTKGIGMVTQTGNQEEEAHGGMKPGPKSPSLQEKAVR